MENKVRIYQLRGGAPDKFKLSTSDRIKLVHVDHSKLSDFSVKELASMKKWNEYILPADEGDIAYATKFNGFTITDCILLPKMGNRVIDPKIVNKNSPIYTVVSHNKITYMSYLVESDKDKVWDLLNTSPTVALKTLTGSGSRGVLLKDKSRLHLGGKYREHITGEEFEDFWKYYEDQVEITGTEGVMLQKLIPNDPKLRKINVDFVIRGGELLGYKWDETDPDAVFTNWNWGYFVRTPFTDDIMTEVVYKLTDFGITDAIMNFEAFTDHKSIVYLVEFNWRYSNSMFEWQAIGEDPLDAYIFNRKMMMPPLGRTKFSRYWQSSTYRSNPNYIDYGKV